MKLKINFKYLEIMSFKIGQKVVCINDECGWLDGVKDLVKDEIYTVKGVFSKDLELVESFGTWDKSRFRPLDYDFVEEVISKLQEETIEL